MYPQPHRDTCTVISLVDQQASVAASPSLVPHGLFGLELAVPVKEENVSAFQLMCKPHDVKPKSWEPVPRLLGQITCTHSWEVSRSDELRMFSQREN